MSMLYLDLPAEVRQCILYYALLPPLKNTTSFDLPKETAAKLRLVSKTVEPDLAPVIRRLQKLRKALKEEKKLVFREMDDGDTVEDELRCAWAGIASLDLHVDPDPDQESQQLLARMGQICKDITEIQVRQRQARDRVFTIYFWKRELKRLDPIEIARRSVRKFLIAAKENYD